MNSKRFYLILLASTLLLGALSIVSVYFGRSLLASKTQELDDLKLTSAALEEQERSLVDAKEEIEQYQELREVAESVVPQEKDQARTIRELVSIAERSGVNIGNIAFPSSSLGEEQTDNIDKTQLEAVKGIVGVSQLELTVNISDPIDYETLVNFLGRLENNRRTSAISSITISPTISESSSLTFNTNLQLLVFIKS